MHISLPYAKAPLEADIDWGCFWGVLDVADVPAPPDVDAAALSALTHPIGLDRDIFHTVLPGESVAIVVSDSFRKTGIHLILPMLLEGLAKRGVRDENICFVFATGSHRAPTPREQEAILGEEAYARFRARAFVHDCDDEAGLVALGRTSRGTPVLINRRVHEAARVIVTGSVVLHYFGGFGGGRKALVPGLAGRETIARNHILNLDPLENRLNPDVRIGALDGNPVAEDMLEAARMTRADCLINTVLDRHGRIARIFAGDLDAAHRAACDFARSLFCIPIRQQADLVVAAAAETGNFVQAHKALFHACLAVRPGGRVVLAAPCSEGLGGDQFVKWLRLGGPETVFDRLRESAEINGQTALSSLQKGPFTHLVTEMSGEDVALLGAQKAATLSEALEGARAILGAAGVHRPAYYLMPTAAYAVPMLGD